MRAQFRGGPLAGGGDSGAQSPRGVSPGGTRNLTTNGHATSGEPSLPPRPGIHYLLVPCQPPNRHSYLILIYYLPRSVPAITRSPYPTFRWAFRRRERERERERKVSRDKNGHGASRASHCSHYRGKEGRKEGESPREIEDDPRRMVEFWNDVRIDRGLRTSFDSNGDWDWVDPGVGR